MGIQFKWLAHSTFMMELDGHPVLFDPFLTGNPLAAAEPGTLSPEFILLSHAHGDHVADALPIARRTNAHIVCNAEMSYWFNGKGYQHVTGGNTGGSIDFDFMRVKFTIAFHSSTFPDGSSGGSPNGFVITLRDSGLRLYYAGDTALYSDMSLIGGVRAGPVKVRDLGWVGEGHVYVYSTATQVGRRWLRPVTTAKVIQPMTASRFPGPPTTTNQAGSSRRTNPARTPKATSP